MNDSFNVFSKISKEERINWNLFIDAEYKGDSTKKHFGGEVLPPLLGVKNQGGFRYLGKKEKPNLVVLFVKDNKYWKDKVDKSTGVFLYYGDNNVAGKELHKSKLHGNEILRNMFNSAASDDKESRKQIPPVLVFKRTSGRNVKFLGLVVPGVKGKPEKEWLTAVWGCDEDQDRYQNYKAYFTIVDISSGSKYSEGSGINLAWLNDIEQGAAYESEYAPKAWKEYIRSGTYKPLVCKANSKKVTKKQQLPAEQDKIQMLKSIHDFFIEKDRGYSFERFAADIVKSMDDGIVEIEVTRPYKDGGFDAEGKYKIFKSAERAVFVDFYLQAKCYSDTTAVNITDTARLISRIKNRQFGIMITTSYITDQAYKEINEDGHPVVFITGRDIIEYIYNEFEIRTKESLLEWLNLRYK